MITREAFNSAIAIVLALSLLCSPARALVSLNDGHDHINVIASAGTSWDSNVYANREARSDHTVNTSVVAEYTRRAGWIGVNGTVAIDSTRYNVFKSENFNNPRFNVEFTKQTGRTTGSLTLAAARQSRADAAVNVRSTSWNYNAGFNYKYRIANLYTLSGHFGYSFIDYVANSTTFPDLATYTASVDLIRVFTTERDISLGYRFRKIETAENASYDDHAVNAGLSGRLISGVMGSLRAGYQVRSPHGFLPFGIPQPKFSSWTASGSATYALNKRTNFTGSVGKDFSTTANDVSVDTSTASLIADFAYNSHLTLNASVTAGDSRFLGDAGKVIVSLGPPPVLGDSRHDKFLSANASVAYSLNQHLKASLGYTWFRNWSNSSFADFARETYDFSVSSGW